MKDWEERGTFAFIFMVFTFIVIALGYAAIRGLMMVELDDFLKGTGVVVGLVGVYGFFYWLTGIGGPVADKTTYTCGCVVYHQNHNATWYCQRAECFRRGVPG